MEWFTAIENQNETHHRGHASRQTTALIRGRRPGIGSDKLLGARFRAEGQRSAVRSRRTVFGWTLTPPGTQPLRAADSNRRRRRRRAQCRRGDGAVGRLMLSWSSRLGAVPVRGYRRSIATATCHRPPPHEAGAGRLFSKYSAGVVEQSTAHLDPQTRIVSRRCKSSRQST